MYRLSFLLLAGSVVITVWMSYELGLLSFTDTMANEAPKKVEHAEKPAPKVAPKAAPKVEAKAEPKVEAKAEPKVEAKAEAKTEPVAATKPEPSPGAGIESLQQSLPARERELAAREAELTKRERQISDKDATLAGQSARYESIIRELQKKIAALEALNDSKIEAFKKLYEKMETKKVASILGEMDPPMAAQILGEMKPSMAGEIMSKMPNDKVRTLTEKYLVKRMTASAKSVGQ